MSVTMTQEMISSEKARPTEPQQPTSLEKHKKTVGFLTFWVKIVGKPSIFQLFPTFIVFFQLSNFFRVLQGQGHRGQAAQAPKTSQIVGKFEKHHKSWKKLENVGKSWKIEGFPTILIKKVGKPSAFLSFCVKYNVLADTVS